MSSAYAPIEVGCEAYIVHEGKLLLGKRKNVYGAGTWAMPGGRLEFMEFADAGIIRELIEEMDITVTPQDVRLLAVTDDPQPDHEQHHLHLTFRVDIGSQEPKIMEPEACGEWRWFDLNALPAPLFPPHVKILATIDSGKTYSRDSVSSNS